MDIRVSAFFNFPSKLYGKEICQDTYYNNDICAFSEFSYTVYYPHKAHWKYKGNFGKYKGNHTLFLFSDFRY